MLAAKPQLRSKDPDPFNFATTSIIYTEVNENITGIVSQIVYQGWMIGNISGVFKPASALGIYSSVYLIITEQGKFILRESKINQLPQETINNQCLIYAFHNNLPVPEIIRTRNNNNCFQTHNKIYTVSRLIEGEYFDGSRNELSQAAILLAKFHQIFRNSRLKKKVFELKPDPYTYKSNLHRNLHLQLDYLNIPDRVQNIVLSHSSVSKYISGLSTQIGHFDLNPHNIIFNKSSILMGLLDFDLVRVSQRARDVSIAMYKLARTFGVMTERKSDIGSSIIDRCNYFLGIYQKINPLTDKEINMIPYFVKDETVKKFLYVIRNYISSKDDLYLKEISKFVIQLGEIEDNFSVTIPS